MAGLFPFTKPGRALLLAAPPAFGVILFGFAPPGTAVPLGRGIPGFGAILFLLFLFALLLAAAAAAAAAPAAPGLAGIIFGSSFFFFGLSNCERSIV